VSQEERTGPNAKPAEEPTRREAFVKLGIGAVGAACAGAAVFGYEFLSPNVLYEPSPVANAGKPDHYPVGSVTQDLKAGIYVVHSPDGFYSISAICTHLGCLTVWNADLGIVACPCHGSKFNEQGVKIDGPAPRGLPWLKVWLTEEGDLLVDRSTTIPPRQFLRT
jgi:cytochrome b6-f complex iron-sulfur subunit